MYKNVSGQKVAIYAHDTLTDTAKTGDQANITADISLDGGASAPTNDVNPTQLDAANLPGVYVFDMTQAETNADLFVLVAQSTTAGVQIEPVIVYTTLLTPTKAAFLDIAISSRSTLTQAQVLSDATPFAGANIDAAISSRSTLTQAQILSDAAPFAGADIAAILDDTGTNGVIISLATMLSIADEVLKRGVSNVQNIADTTSLAAMVLAAFESAIVGTTWTIRKTDGSTFMVKTVTVSASAAPVTGVT